MRRRRGNSAPFQAHSDTSIAAAVAIEPSVSGLRRIVLDAIAAAPGGLTDEEMIKATGLRPNTARPRRIELVAKGFVVDSERKRLGASGRFMVVWIPAGTPPPPPAARKPRKPRAARRSVQGSLWDTPKGPDHPWSK